MTEAVLSLEASVESEKDDGDGGASVVGGGGSDGGESVGGGAASSAVYLDVETLPDVPGGVALVTCKV